MLRASDWDHIHLTSSKVSISIPLQMCCRMIVLQSSIVLLEIGEHPASNDYHHCHQDPSQLENLYHNDGPSRPPVLRAIQSQQQGLSQPCDPTNPLVSG